MLWQLSLLLSLSYRWNHNLHCSLKSANVKLWVNNLMVIMLSEMRIGASVCFLSFLSFFFFWYTHNTLPVPLHLHLPLFFSSSHCTFALTSRWAHLLYILKLTLDLPCGSHWDLKRSHFPFSLILHTHISQHCNWAKTCIFHLHIRHEQPYKTGRHDLWRNLTASSLINLITYWRARSHSVQSLYVASKIYNSKIFLYLQYIMHFIYIKYIKGDKN